MNLPGTHSALRSGLALALGLLLFGCGEDGSGDASLTPIGLTPPPALPVIPPPPIPPPPPCSVNPIPAECGTVEFQAFSAAGALANVAADIFVQPEKGWGPETVYWNLYGEFRSDQTGYFVTKALPPATLTVRAFAEPDYSFQPCAAIIKSPSAAVTRIELFPPAAFDTAEALRPVNATESSLVGTVYETTPEGRKPVSGASLLIGYEDAWQYWWFDGPTIAATMSSLAGHYYFCNLPTDIQIYVSKIGFEDAFVHPGVVAAGAPIDIVLVRKGT